MSVNPLEHIAFEDINETYCYGMYYDFKIIMIKSNGYVNATQMCNYISDVVNIQKRFRNWKATASSIELINALSSSAGIPADELLVELKPCNELRGTYVHPKLIPDITSWASKKFALKVADIVNQYFNSKALAEKDAIIQERDDRIDQLIKEMRHDRKCAKQERKRAEEERERLEQERKEECERIEQEAKLRHDESMAKIDRLLRKNKKISHKLGDMTERNELLIQQNDELSHQSTDILDRLNQAAEDRAPVPDDIQKTNSFAILKDDTHGVAMPYYAVGTQKCNLESTIAKRKQLNDNVRVLMSIQYNPNSVNLWVRIKTDLRGRIEFHANLFKLIGNYTEDELIQDVHRINNEKYDV
jgi:hypothetical protein